MRGKRLSSADFMTRNIERRIEVACPIKDIEAKEYIEDLIDLVLHDNVKARVKTSSDKYEKLPLNKGDQHINSQLMLFEKAYESSAE